MFDLPSVSKDDGFNVQADRLLSLGHGVCMVDCGAGWSPKNVAEIFPEKKTRTKNSSHSLARATQ